MIWAFDHLLELWRVRQADRLMPPSFDGLVAFDRETDAERLAAAALTYANSCIGRGETEGNNRGPFIRNVCHPATDGNNWCAAFVGYCYDGAAEQLGIPPPFTRSLGAKRLGANVAAVGRRFTDPAEAKPGDLMVFHRGAQGSWAGHVAMVESSELTIHSQMHGDAYRIHTVEGNCGPKVKRCVRWVERDRFAFFASLRR